MNFVMPTANWKTRYLVEIEELLFALADRLFPVSHPMMIGGLLFSRLTLWLTEIGITQYVIQKSVCVRIHTLLAPHGSELNVSRIRFGSYRGFNNVYLCKFPASFFYMEES